MRYVRPAAQVEKDLGAKAVKLARLEDSKKVITDFNVALKATNDGLPVNRVANVLRLEHHSNYPKTPKELHDYIRIVYGMDVPWRPVVEGFDSPFHAFVAIYFRLYARMLLLGPRNSGKTKGLSVMADLTARAEPGSSWVHASAQKSQADVVGKAMQDYRSDPVLGKNYTYETHVSTINFRNGSAWYRVTGTPSGVNSHHPNTLSLDEIEWWPTAAIDQTYAVPTTRNGRLDVWVGVSTRQRAAGAMAYLYEHAADYGIKTFSYSIFECMAPCKTCVAIDKEPYGTDVARNEACALWEDCRGVYGRLSQGFIPRAMVEAYKKLRVDLWDAQFMCRKPSTTGLVYPTFDKDMAKFNSNGVWQSGGNTYPWNFNPDWSYEIWHDPAEGGTATFWFVQRDPRYGYLFLFDLLVVPQCAHQGQSKEALVEFIYDRGYPDPEFIVVDPHKPDSRKHLCDGALLPITGVLKRFNAVSPTMPRDIDKRNGEIKGTIPIVASYWLDAHRKRWMFVHPLKCKAGIDKGITQYSYPTDQKTFEVNLNANPLKDGADDYCDPIRYGVVWDKTKRRGGPLMGYSSGDILQSASYLDSQISSTIDV